MMTKKRCAIALFGFVTIFICLAIWAASGHMPGTLYFDVSGEAHGAGTELYRYDNGELMLRERYIAGKIVESTWYKPDGTLVATEEWEDETGVGYYLRQDGSIRVKMTYVKGLAHGPATYYTEDGAIEKVVEFINGKEAADEQATEG